MDHHSEACAIALARALEVVTAEMRGVAGPREYDAFQAGFRVGWKARTAKKGLTDDEICNAARRPDAVYRRL